MSFWAAWTHWYGYSLEPGVWAPVLLSAWLYWRGLRGTRWAHSSVDRTRRWRAISFYAGLAVVLFALEGPVDYLADYLFWVHMAEHCLLQVVAAPLIVIGAPWTPMWRGLPLRWRRAIAPRGLRLARRAPLRAIGHALRTPAAGLVALALTFWVWHIPVAYDQTLYNPVIHDFEHLTLLLGGLEYWSLAVDSPPLRCPLQPFGLAGYLVGGAAIMWVVALTLGLASHPFYAPYYDLAVRPGGISALTDQQWGAGVAWVPAAIPFELMLDVVAYRWLRDDHARAEARVAAFRRAELADREVGSASDVGGRS